ncbi:MAG: hypothetical protein CME65_13425 [Halobacteriovoraceae bacterium]|nr:hypothetical protein [Halobacteriovoraceae bacterium]
MSILFQMQNLSLAFGQKVLFNQTKLAVNEGDKIGLIGLNGHGKSTLFKIISGDVTPDKTNPPFIFDTHNDKFSVTTIPQELPVQEFSHLSISDFYLSLYPDLLHINEELKKIEKKLATDYQEADLDIQQSLFDQMDQKQGWSIQQSYISYLKNFELNNLDRPVLKLSGGEQRKMALAMGLSSPSNIILWDEPTNHLDTETIEKFEEELKKSQKTFLIISHDRYLLNETTTRIIHIERGELRSFDGNYLGYLEYQEEREKELAKNLDKLTNKHRRELDWMRQGVKARRTRSKKRVESFQHLENDIRKLKDSTKRKLDLSLSHSGNKAKVLFEIHNGNFSYAQNTIFNDLNLSLYRGNKIALMGPNGAGKSTLVNLVAGHEKFDSGKITFPKEIKSVVFDQKRATLDLNKTPFEIIGDGKDQVHLPSGKTEHVNGYLQKFLFTKDQLNRPIAGLSGGEKNRLQLALFMQQSADLFIFDEPTNDLDIESIEMLERTLIDYKQSVIIISHDRSFLDKTCTHSWLIEDKNIKVFTGGFSQVADYIIEKKHLENLEKQTKLKDATNTSSQESTSKKMSYNEKQRWQTIEPEIENLEFQLKDIKEQLASYDFSQTEKYDEYQNLEKEHHRLEAKLEKLMIEWENLSEKDPD